ncbi:hypothetical protein BS78_07G099000 [Paspalum vaginatum]|nr:hypothetical protein BS78_07G099000 [Paspalum vaginatum]
MPSTSVRALSPLHHLSVPQSKLTWSGRSLAQALSAVHLVPHTARDSFSLFGPGARGDVEVADREHGECNGEGVPVAGPAAPPRRPRPHWNSRASADASRRQPQADAPPAVGPRTRPRHRTALVLSRRVQRSRPAEGLAWSGAERALQRLAARAPDGAQRCVRKRPRPLLPGRGVVSWRGEV